MLKRGTDEPVLEEGAVLDADVLDNLGLNEIDLTTLKARSLVPKRVECVKILGEGDLSKKLTVKAHRFSEVAKDKITKAGGQALSLDTPKAE